MQRERYVDYTRDQCFKNTMDYSHWRANPRLVRAIIDESGATICLAAEPGSRVRRRDHQHARVAAAPTTSSRAGAKRWSRPWSTRRRARASAPARHSGGRPFSRRATASAASSPTSDGDEVEVAVKAVVVASGGFANNKEWIKKYTGYDLGVEPVPGGQHRQDRRRSAHGLGSGRGRGGREHHRDVPGRAHRRRVRHGLQPRAGVGPARPVGDRPRRALLRRDHHLLGHPGRQRPGPLHEGRLHLQHLRRLHHRAADRRTVSTRAWAWTSRPASS